jgi:DNA repair protein RecN (Recombination protein N)
MLTGLSIRDVVLIERLDLEIGPGLTALTGETGAGKSIVLDALGLATGQRAEAGLVRRGAVQGTASAVFAPAPSHPVWALMTEKGLDGDSGGDLVLRRQLGADGRSRAFINDQPASVAALRELGALLLEVHGQHETVGLLDVRTHRGLLDAFAGAGRLLDETSAAWAAARDARAQAEALVQSSARAEAEAAVLADRLAELDRLDAKVGEEAALAEERALLGAAEKSLSDISSARQAVAAEGVSGRLAQALRAMERARERAVSAGAAAGGGAAVRLTEAADALERALVEADEAARAIDRAAESFLFEPDRLEQAETRLFALRGAARRLGVEVDDLPRLRTETADALRALETSDEALGAARAAAEAAEARHQAAVARLTALRNSAGAKLAKAVERELKPLKLERARFQVAVEPLLPERVGPAGGDRVAFEVSTNPGAPFAPLDAIASGGELARFALALKAVLASGGATGAGGPVLIFDEVDQGVGGAVADAVGLRLKSLAEASQVIVVTHSPQVAARADVQWRVTKTGGTERVRTAVETLGPEAREEEIARMLAGAEVTDAARAAARALIAA